MPSAVASIVVANTATTIACQIDSAAAGPLTRCCHATSPTSPTAIAVRRAQIRVDPIRRLASRSVHASRRRAFTTSPERPLALDAGVGDRAEVELLERGR